MVLVNVLLSLLFIFACFVVSLSVEEWLSTGREGLYVVTSLSPFWVQMDITEPLPVGLLGHIDIPNYPFYLFWVVIAVNLYFIFRLQRSKETARSL